MKAMTDETNHCWHFLSSNSVRMAIVKFLVQRQRQSHSVWWYLKDMG